jgi:prepilin-type N-terminal cleavage/methylation domain-containing protein
MKGAGECCGTTVQRAPCRIRKGACSGFSLVEVLVSAAILSISFVSIVAFIRKGHEQIALDRHRRSARGIIERTLESARFQPESYVLFDSAPAPEITIDAIDPKTGLTGTVTVTVGREQQSMQGAAIPYRPISASVVWNEPSNPDVVSPETVRVEKWLTKVQRR